MKILVSGFEPFGGELVNSAWEAVCRLPDEMDGIELVKCQVPTAFLRAFSVLQDLMEKERPDAVVCVGQAGGRSGICAEKVAINLQEARIPDNDGRQPGNVPVVKDGPAAYFSTLPVEDMVQAIRTAGIPAFVSYTAGTFVCNDLMYRLLHWVDQHPVRTIGGFIHVPYIPSQVLDKPAGTPSMALEDIVQGLMAALAVLKKTTDQAPAAQDPNVSNCL